MTSESESFHQMADRKILYTNREPIPFSHKNDTKKQIAKKKLFQSKSTNLT